MSIFLFSLFDGLFLIFFYFLCVLTGIVKFFCWSGRVLLNFSFNFWNCISGLVLQCFFISSSRFLLRPYDGHFLFIRSCNFYWNAYVTSFFALSGARFLQLKEFELLWGAVFFKDLFTHFHDSWSQIGVMILVTPKPEVEWKSEWFCGVKFYRSKFKVELVKGCLNKNSLSR